MTSPPARSCVRYRQIPRYEAAFGFVRIVPSVCAGFAIAIGVAFAQPTAPAFGKPGEAIQSGFAEELLRARGLKSPLGEVRARADLVPR